MLTSRHHVVGAIHVGECVYIVMFYMGVCGQWKGGGACVVCVCACVMGLEESDTETEKRNRQGERRTDKDRNGDGGRESSGEEGREEGE